MFVFKSNMSLKNSKIWPIHTLQVKRLQIRIPKMDAQMNLNDFKGLSGYVRVGQILEFDKSLLKFNFIDFFGNFFSSSLGNARTFTRCLSSFGNWVVAAALAEFSRTFSYRFTTWFPTIPPSKKWSWSFATNKSKSYQTFFPDTDTPVACIINILQS